MAKELGVIADPEIFVFDKSKSKCRADAIVIASDGIWDVMKNEEVS